MKNEKIVYDNQNEVHDTIVGFAKSILRPANEAYLIGSSTTGTFGKYPGKSEGRKESDIDVVVMIDENKIPKDWKPMGIEKKWWTGYAGDKLEINGTRHKAEFMVVKPGMEDFAHKRMEELGWKPEKLK
jgi:predicted nucleotidyltransferase